MISFSLAYPQSSIEAKRLKERKRKRVIHSYLHKYDFAGL
jgi:hypothetical protein